MGIKANATKRNGLSIVGAYLMVVSVQAQKFLRPGTELNPETGQVVLHDAVQYVGRVQVYWNEAVRRASFGDAVATVAFEFTHVNGQDPVHECYAHVKLLGMEDWTLTQVTDVFETVPQAE